MLYSRLPVVRKFGLYLLWLALATPLVAEILLLIVSRAFYPRLTVTDATLGWKYLPGATAERDFNVRMWASGASIPQKIKYRLTINSEGFRDDEFTRDPKSLKIMVLGDSMTFGLEVGQHETYSSQLEQKLKAELPGTGVDVMNFGITGFSTAQALRVVDRYFPVYRPDVVTLGLFEGNDFEDNAQVFHDRFHPHFDLVGEQLVPHSNPTWAQSLGNKFRDYSVIYFLLIHRFGLLNASHQMSEEEKITLLQRLVGRISSYLAEKGKPLLILYFRQTENNSRFSSVQGFAQKAGIPFAEIPLEPLHRVGSLGHFNADGHRHVASVLRRTLTETGLLERALRPEQAIERTARRGHGQSSRP